LGAVAAPAVLTLHTGHATAMASNLRCMNNQVDNPVAPFALASPSDSYVRVRLWSLRPNAGASDVRWYLRGADIDALALFGGAGNRFLRTGEWKRFDVPVTGTDHGAESTQPRWSTGKAGAWAQDGLWVAIRFTADFMGADIIGVVGAGTGGSAVSGSCWSSFA
jgi:hypothetical protein